MTRDDAVFACVMSEYARYMDSLSYSMSLSAHWHEQSWWVMSFAWRRAVWESPGIACRRMMDIACGNGGHDTLVGIRVMAARGYGQPRLTQDPASELPGMLRVRALTLEEMMMR